MSTRAGRTYSLSTPDVLEPATLSDLLQILKREPEIPIWSGGTWWMDRGMRRTRLVALHGVAELKRVVRSDIRVDVGAAVSVGRLREAGGRFLPPPLVAALDQLGPPPVRNLATLGGALSIREGSLPVAVVLQLLDSRAEIRRQGHTRWASINKIDLVPGEVLTRIRIPLRLRTHWMLHHFGTAFPISPPSLTVAASATVEKSSLEELHAAILINGVHFIRLREAESEVVGRSLPLTERDLRTILGALEEERAFRNDLDDLGRWRATGTLRQFLRTL
ncbi:MAG: hypothetical protein EA427_11640 [Spirochaetaceae bacterium]|nr:MAG: hypothetical protein EA427_11640 [Spirochaetaceae bacterium]